MLENASRHGDGRITLSASASASRVELHVRDEGAGFAPELLPRAFQRFTGGTARTGGAAPGSGLPSSKRWPGRGGRVSAANCERGGADGRIEIPARGAAPPR